MHNALDGYPGHGPLRFVSFKQLFQLMCSDSTSGSYPRFLLVQFACPSKANLGVGFGASSPPVSAWRIWFQSGNAFARPRPELYKTPKQAVSKPAIQICTASCLCHSHRPPPELPRPDQRPAATERDHPLPVTAEVPSCELQVGGASRC